jgi:hypothetical protein
MRRGCTWRRASSQRCLERVVGFDKKLWPMQMKVLEQSQGTQAMGRCRERAMCGWQDERGGEDRPGDGQMKGKERAGGAPHLTGRCSTPRRMGNRKGMEEKEGKEQVARPGVGRPDQVSKSICTFGTLGTVPNVQFLHSSKASRTQGKNRPPARACTRHTRTLEEDK